jgi:mannose-1-phosphate guanylyltransferase
LPPPARAPLSALEQDYERDALLAAEERARRDAAAEKLRELEERLETKRLLLERERGEAAAAALAAAAAAAAPLQSALLGPADSAVSWNPHAAAVEALNASKTE